VPYSQSGPGSLVSAVLLTSLSPTWGFELFTAPKPQPYMSRREQRPPSSGTRKVGIVKPGASQQVLLRQPAGFVGVAHSGIPAHGASGFPHAMQAVRLQVGAGSASAIVNTVLIPDGNESSTPSAVKNGVGTH